MRKPTEEEFKEFADQLELVKLHIANLEAKITGPYKNTTSFSSLAWSAFYVMNSAAELQNNATKLHESVKALESSLESN